MIKEFELLLLTRKYGGTPYKEPVLIYKVRGNCLRQNQNMSVLRQSKYFKGHFWSTVCVGGYFV